MVSKAKPLSFSTTIRNPARIPAFLHCILPYEGMLLTSKIIHKVIKNVIREKEYTPTYVSRIPKLKAISKSEDSTFTDTQLEDIILNSPQQHKEAGFDYGWDSRFDTWYKMIKEFGFIKYSMNNPIEITKTGHMIVDAYMEGNWTPMVMPISQPVAVAQQKPKENKAPTIIIKKYYKEDDSCCNIF